MKDIDVLIANYQSIIRVLASQVRALEAEANKTGCTLLPEECTVLNDFIMDEGWTCESRRDYGNDKVFLSAWEKIRKGRDLND